MAFGRPAKSSIGSFGWRARPAPRTQNNRHLTWSTTAINKRVNHWGWTSIASSARGSRSWAGSSNRFGVLAPPGFPTVDLTITESYGVLSLQAVPGGRACSEVWLHNGGPKDLGEVKLRCSDLLRHDGGVVAARAVRFEPDVVAMPARSSRGVCVEVDVAEDLPAGGYRGTLLAHGHPDVWLPVLLNVPAP